MKARMCILLVIVGKGQDLRCRVHAGHHLSVGSRQRCSRPQDVRSSAARIQIDSIE
jgi:hypothetical protein